MDNIWIIYIWITNIIFKYQSSDTIIISWLFKNHVSYQLSNTESNTHENDLFWKKHCQISVPILRNRLLFDGNSQDTWFPGICFSWMQLATYKTNTQKLPAIFPNGGHQQGRQGQDSHLDPLARFKQGEANSSKLFGTLLTKALESDQHIRPAHII